MEIKNASIQFSKDSLGFFHSFNVDFRKLIRCLVILLISRYIQRVTSCTVFGVNGVDSNSHIKNNGAGIIRINMYQIIDNALKINMFISK